MKKTVLITGASRGIGRATALRFAREGYTVLIGYRERLSDALAVKKLITDGGGRAEVFCVDVADFNAVCSCVKGLEKEYGVISTLVLNAGISLTKQINDTTPEDWDRVFNVNVKGAYNLVKATLDGMISQKFGRIVTVSSVWGEVGASCEVAYSASKAALIGFTKALAKELAPSNITVNCVTPGVIDTEMNACYTLEERTALEGEIPAGRYGTPEEVADAIYFLAAEGNGYVTGEVLGVNGGFR